METFEQKQGDEIQRLQQQLEDARREGQDIYQIARLLQMLKLRGAELIATKQELRQISENLEKARRRESQRLLVQGYEVARWLMIQQVLQPEAVEIKEEDRRAIAEAVKEYQDDQNFRQIASLIKTAEFIGVSVPLDDLTDKERNIVMEELSSIE